LKQLTDKNINEIKLPNLFIISKDDFIQKNLKLNEMKLNSKLKQQEYKITKSSYLPKVSFNGKLGNQNYNSDDNKKDMHGNYYNFGLTFNIPLDFNKKIDLKSSKIAYLKAKQLENDNKKIQSIKYDKFKINYQFFDEKINIAKQNIKLFDELIKLTANEVKAGYKTQYDLQTLQNSKNIELLEIKINKINKKLEAIKLYFAVLYS
jgi:outer membrane protein TolC